MSLTAYCKVVKQYTDETGKPPPDEAIASDEDGNQINVVQQDATLVSGEGRGTADGGDTQHHTASVKE